MSERERSRDPAAEELERLSFVILQHVYTLGGAGESLPLVGRIASDLAVPVQLVVQLVAHLTYTGFLEWTGTGHPVAVTDKGVEYIEKLAHRRRSLRVFTTEVGAE